MNLRIWIIFQVMLMIIAAAADTQNPKSLDPANLDTTFLPGENFFQYANGNWMRSNPIPGDYARYGAFEVLWEKNLTNLYCLLQELANQQQKPGSNRQKIGDFYATGMDTISIERQGMDPIRPELEAIDNIKDIQELQATVAHFHRIGIYPLFYISAGSDDKNSSLSIAQIYQGGLGLPDRDYYLQDDGRSKKIREQYKHHIKTMFTLAGFDSPPKASSVIMDIETRLAKASMNRLERRDPHKTYNKTTLSDLAEHSRTFNWHHYFALLGNPEPGDLNLNQPDFIKAVDTLLTVIPVDHWKQYLRWNLINSTAPYLNSVFVNQNFQFYGKALSGTEEMRSRWKRVLMRTSQSLPEALGQIYVDKYFPPEAKQRMLELVSNLKLALGERINRLDWMSKTTKLYALEKLDSMNVKIGYPDKWIDYSSLCIEPDSYVRNVLRANAFEFQRTLNKMDKPVDPDEWHLSPQTVNAYYNPSMNEIVFPAAILQYPFFNRQADDAVNYGAIGMVIGHEMTHGFDDKGRLFDKDGNLKDWWTETDSKQFEKRSQILITQYNHFSVFDTLHVDGELTLGENIADLGGLQIAYDALQRAYEKHGMPEPIDGFTADQRFFLGYAQVWRQNIRDEELMRRLKEDVHSPGRFRVNGPLRNMDVFYKAFNVGPEMSMYIPPDKRAQIW